MDSHHLRAIIIRLQDRLSDDDRRRLHFFFGNNVPRRIRDDPTLGGTLCLMESLFDQDKINENDVTFLIEAFEQIQCLDAAKLLREYKQRIRSSDLDASIQSLTSVFPERPYPLASNEEEDKVASWEIYGEKKKDSGNYCSTINEMTVVEPPMSRDELAAHPIRKKTITSMLVSKIHVWNHLSPMTIHLLWVLLLVVALAAVISGFCIRVTTLKSIIRTNAATHWEELKRDNATIHELKATIAERNRTIYQLHEEIAANAHAANPQAHWQESQVCTCDAWCRGTGKRYGICGDGHTCICRDEPITKATSAEGCSCDSWCKTRGHPNGGICGDGYTCICS